MATDPQTNQTSSIDSYAEPVAYDKDGRPLYAHPPNQAPPSVVHVSRSRNPAEQPIPPEIMQRYEESRKRYPQLNLSKGEYIINAIKRHPIGLVQIWAVVFALIIAFGLVFGQLFTGAGASGLLETLGGEGSAAGVATIMGIFFILIVLGGVVVSYIYDNNKFYLTNESVIQEIQNTPFSRHEQTVSLANIEDASYRQDGILSHIFNYGTIRLSTEGDETTYRFIYVSNPKRHIAVLNNAVEAFKNGRPVDPVHED